MTKNKLTLVAICLAICLLPSTLAFWRLPCTKPLTIERTDPITDFGKTAQHVHTVMGASGFHAKATPDSIRKSKCSTCTVKQDNSNYWIANLFFQHPDGSMESVPQEGGMLVYYLQRKGSDNGKLQAFPPGLRMLAGDAEKRKGDKSRETRAITYNCINYAKPNPETNAFPQQNCPQGFRVQVFFPSCWNGKDIDSADHRSHMAYPDGVDSGNCPASHPVRLISIFYEVMYRAEKFADSWLDASGKPKRAMPFFWSTGDNTGFGHHGDFLNGWDTNVLQKAVDECTDMSGVVEKCQHFKFRTDDEARACQHEFPLKNKETVTGKMSQIPNVSKVPVGRFDACGISPNQAFDNTQAGQPLGSCKGQFTNKPAYTPINGKHHK